MYVIWHIKQIMFQGSCMTIYTITQARANLFNIVDETNITHEPIYIKGKRNDAVILSKEDYEAIQDTLYLQSKPGLVESILAASKDSSDQFIANDEFWKS